MTAKSSSVTEASQLELVITRVIDAPRRRVFAMWTEREHLMHWWGPEGFTLPGCEIDLRPGGTYRFHMRERDGTDHWLQGVYLEVVVPERIVCSFRWTDAAGKPAGPETLLTVTFAELAEKTALTLRHTGFETTAACDEHHHGWSGSLERLANLPATM